MANNSEILGEEAAVRQIVENDFSATNGHFEDDTVNSLRGSSFYGKSTLKSASFPNVTEIAGNVFYGCINLRQLSMPKLVNITSGNSFRNVTSKLMFPLLTSLTTVSCFALAKGTVIDAGFISSFGLSTFQQCSNMIALILRKNAVVTNSAPNAFNDSKYATSGAGGAYVYVPRDLISTYQSATNWATLYAAHSDMFRPLEDYTVDGTTTGEFDYALIATPTNPMYAVTNLDVSVDENHQRYITTTAEGHITYSSGAFTSENWSAVRIQSDEVGKSVSGNYFSIPAGSTVTIVIKNMTATQWNSVNGQRNQVSVRIMQSGAALLDVSWNDLKKAFYTDGLHRYEESYTNTGNSAITVVFIDLYGSLTPNNTLDFGLMVLLDGVRII